MDLFHEEKVRGTQQNVSTAQDTYLVSERLRKIFVALQLQAAVRNVPNTVHY